MRAVIASLAFALAACGQPAAPAADTTAPAPVTDAVGPMSGVIAMSTGEMGAMSNTAMSITGSLTVSADALTFENGFTAHTETLGGVDATTLIAEGGQSFAAAAPGPTSLQIELRRITGTAPTQLCGAPGATYVALAHDDPLTGLTLIVFSGADMPGPTAHESAVCATYGYAVD